MASTNINASAMTFLDIQSAAARLRPGPLDEPSLATHIHPLFSRVLARNELYLANHSLGRPLDRVATDLSRFADLWQSDMDEAWGPWMSEISAFRAGVSSVLGLSQPDAVVPRPGAGQGLRSVLNALPRPKDGRLHHVVTTRAEFDSIDFIIKTYELAGRIRVTWIPTHEGLIDQDELIRAVDASVDLVAISHVIFATGQLLDRAAEIVHAAHRADALCLLDMYHSAGVIPLSLETIGADFAIGGSYKYFRGGPGAGWLAIHPRHLSTDQPSLRTLDTGWFAKRDTFGFARADRPLLASGGDAWMECTPAAATAYQASAGIALLLALGVERLRAYSLEQQTFLADQLQQRGVEVRWIEPHGAFLLVPSPDAPALSRSLKAAGLNTDARGPHVRLCPDILNTRDELTRAASIVASVKAATSL